MNDDAYVPVLRSPILIFSLQHTPLIPHCSRTNQLPMLVNLKHLMSVRGTRCYSQLRSVAASSTPQIIPSLPSNTSKHAKDVRYPYFIRRNSRGSLPVYTDIRNGGTRYLISIRNVNGQINVNTPSSAYLFLRTVF